MTTKNCGIYSSTLGVCMPDLYENTEYCSFNKETKLDIKTIELNRKPLLSFLTLDNKRFVDIDTFLRNSFKTRYNILVDNYNKLA